MSEYVGLHMIPDKQKDQRVCGDINNGLSTGPKMSPPLSRRPCSESHYAPDGRGSSVTLGPALDKTAHYNHAPSWHSTWLYGGDTSTPFFILRTGNIVGAGGGGGEAISTTWAVLSTRVPVPRYFG